VAMKRWEEERPVMNQGQWQEGALRRSLDVTKIILVIIGEGARSP
jgi:hypothetical protein